jgi:hypothetical protein
MQSALLEQFKGLGFLAGWLAVALLIGFSLFYAWDLIYKRAQKENEPSEPRSRTDEEKSIESQIS